MAEPVNIRISLSTENLGVIEHLKRSLTEVQQKATIRVTTQMTGQEGPFTGRDFPRPPGGFFRPPPDNPPNPFLPRLSRLDDPVRTAHGRLQAEQAVMQQAASQSNMALGRLNVQEYQRLQLMATRAQGQAFTPLQQAHATLGASTSPGAQRTAQGLQRAQLISILGQTPTPLQQAHGQLSTFGTLLQLGHGYQHSLGVAQAQQGLQRGQLISLMAQMGPQGPFSPWAPGMNMPQGPTSPWAPGMNVPRGPTSPWAPPPGTTPWTPAAPFSPWSPPSVPPSGPFSPWSPGMNVSPPPLPPPPGKGGGRAPTAGFARFAGRLGLTAAGLATAGYGLTQLYTQSMDAYETRELGALRIGTTLDEQYGDIRRIVTALRGLYKMTAAQVVGAVSAMSQIVGGQALPGVSSALSFGAAYGMDAQHAATLYGQLALTGASVTPELGIFGARAEQMRRSGITRLPVSRVVEEGVRLGGMTAVPLGETQLANYIAMTSAFGPRYAENQAAAFGQQAAGMAPEGKGLLGQALGWQALAEVAQSTPYVDLGEPGQPGYRRLNIRDNYVDQQIALENAAIIPQMRAGLYRQVQRQSGGDRTTGQLLYEQLFRPSSAYNLAQEYEQYEQWAAQPGGIAALPNQPVTGVLTEAQRQARQQRYGPGFGVLERAANLEAISETPMIQSIQNFQTDLSEIVERVSVTYANHEGHIKAVSAAFEELWGKTVLVTGILDTIVSTFAAMPGMGGVLAGTKIYGIYNKIFGQQGAPVTPTRPGP